MRKAALAAAAVAAIVAGAGAFYFYGGGHATPASQRPLVDLTAESMEGFRADFNRAAGGVRVVLLLSPT